MKQKRKILLLAFLISLLSSLILSVAAVIVVDPFFHYHAPLTKAFKYELDNERYQNNGIIRNFEYDALITGTSMSENFKTSEFDNLFGTKSVKVPFAGGTYKEIDENINLAIKSNKNLKYVVRSIDTLMYLDDSERMRDDLGEYPTYLYDEKIFNDVRYFVDGYNATIKALLSIFRGKKAEQFSFDKYANWHAKYKYGKDSVLTEPVENIYRVQRDINEEERNRMKNNIDKNIVSTPKENPNIKFFYFITPYSSLYWRSRILGNNFNVSFESEKYIIEELSKLENVTLVSLNDCFDITSNLNFYRDELHYGEWINSFILKCFKENKHVVNNENKDTYYLNMNKYLDHYNFSIMNDIVDFDNDEDASKLIEQLIEEGKI